MGGTITDWKGAMAALVLSAAEDAYAYEADFLPTRDTSPVIHRRGRFKPNQRKQRKGIRV